MSGGRLVDRVDLYSWRERERLARRVASQFNRDPGLVMGALALLLDEGERAGDQGAGEPEEAALPEHRRRAAEHLLDQPDLLGRLCAAFASLGCVGETRAKTLLILAVVSRLLVEPLWLRVEGASGSGRTLLLQALVALLPASVVESGGRARLASRDRLSRKVVVIDDPDGSADGAHRRIQGLGLASAGPDVDRRISFALVCASTRREGRLEASRCLATQIDESREQTEAIQAAQRRALAGSPAPAPALQAVRDLHVVLRPAEVVIPFAESLRFPSRTPRDRREQRKILGFVQAHAHLHQRQRGHDEHGRVLAGLADYTAVYELVRTLVESDVDGLSARAASLYATLLDLRPETFTRSDAARSSGQSYMTVSRALSELVSRELVEEIDDGSPRAYRLSERRTGETLMPPDEIDHMHGHLPGT